MNTKMRWKIAIDIRMSVMFLLLMAYQVVGYCWQHCSRDMYLRRRNYPLVAAMAGIRHEHGGCIGICDAVLPGNRFAGRRVGQS